MAAKQIDNRAADIYDRPERRHEVFTHAVDTTELDHPSNLVFGSMLVGLAEIFRENYKVNLPDDIRLKRLFLLSQFTLSRPGPLNKLPFHGWPSHYFTFIHALHAGRQADIAAHPIKVGAAALIGDHNYLVDVRSTAEAGQRSARRLMRLAGFGFRERREIFNAVIEADIVQRSNNPDALVSPATMALSDGDTALKFCALAPTYTSMFFGRERTIAQGLPLTGGSGLNIRKLAEKVIADQGDLADQGKLFYSKAFNELFGPFIKSNIGYFRYVNATPPGEPIQPPPYYGVTMESLPPPYAPINWT